MSSGRVPAEDGNAASRRSRVARVSAKLSPYRERLRSRPLLDKIWRAGIFIIGWLVVLAGVVMLVIPGPGWGAILFGFAVLATEFVWARRLLQQVYRLARRVTERAMRPEGRRRILIVAASLVLLVILATGSYVWLYGVPDAIPFSRGWAVR